MENRLHLEKLSLYCFYFFYLKSIFPQGFKLALLHIHHYLLQNSNSFQFEVNFFKNQIIPFFYFFKNHTFFQCKELMDLFAVDINKDLIRFSILYNLLSLSYNLRIMLKTELSFLENSIQSLHGLYPSSLWLEREVWDMFGIFFKDHPDLRRILTDYGFEGFPLRKDFPLTGFLEVRYDFDIQYVKYEPLELAQSFRNFKFQSPWEWKNN